MSTDDKNQANDKTNDGNNNNNEGKVTFTDAQQAKVQELIDSAVGRTGAKYKEQVQTLQTQVQELNTNLSQATEKLNKFSTSNNNNDKSGDAKEKVAELEAKLQEFQSVGARHKEEVTRLTTQVTEFKKRAEEANSATVTLRKSVAIQQAAAGVGFVDLDAVRTLTENSVVLDKESGQFVVLNENGQPRLNSAMERMTLKEFYSDYAAAKPYLVRSDAKTGAGSTESSRSDVSTNGKYTVEQIFGAKSDARLANDLAKSDKKEYHRLRKIAIEQGLIR